MCLEIRKARPGDAESISSVLLASFLELKPLYSEEGFAVTTPDKERVLSRMAEGPVSTVEPRAPRATLFPIISCGVLIFGSEVIKAAPTTMVLPTHRILVYGALKGGLPRAASRLV